MRSGAVSSRLRCAAGGSWRARARTSPPSRSACFISAKLVDALETCGLGHLIPVNKDELQQQILHLAYADGDLPTVIDYCTSDVTDMPKFDGA